MTTNQMVAAFELVIEYGVDNPTAAQIAKHQKRRAVIKRHYGLKRQPTGVEIQAELDMIERRRAAGTMDDRQAYLAACLDLC